MITADPALDTPSWEVLLEACRLVLRDVPGVTQRRWKTPRLHMPTSRRGRVCLRSAVRAPPRLLWAGPGCLLRVADAPSTSTEGGDVCSVRVALYRAVSRVRYPKRIVQGRDQPNGPAGTPGRDPLVLADKPFGEWNTFYIKMVGDKVTIKLNGKLVVDNAPLTNFWDRKTPTANRKPLIARGPIQLQTHGGEICWRNIFIKELN